MEAEVFDIAGNCLYREIYKLEVSPNKANNIGLLKWKVPVNFSGIFLLRLTSEAGELCGSNIYYFSTDKNTPYRKALFSKGARLKGHLERHSDEKNVVVNLCNTGMAAALHIRLFDRSDSFLLYPEDNFITLLPGESRKIYVNYCKKYIFGFDENKVIADLLLPELCAEDLSGETVILYKEVGEKWQR